jgi:hypothetical protein
MYGKRTTNFHPKLIHTLERWDGLALILVQGGPNDATVLDLNIRFIDVTLECKRMFHPLVIITLWTS